ncbi:IS630 family transposase [Pelovirga terrestris]|uniref:IS630 family transposase n=1 Tax=Pelovirga terrestris TaxID=2771352 RepID=UPI001CD17A06|nr:IS630 family transposase [Pelovirga terrestris]
MAPRYRVTLTKQERKDLEALTRNGKTGAKKFIHARALLLCDAGPDGPAWTVANVAVALGVTPRTIEHLKQRFVEEGIEVALERKPREKPPREVLFDGAFEARLIALACSDAPEGFDRWTVRLLADKAVELKFASSVSHMTVQRVFKKNELKPHLSKYWKIPPQGSAAFVAAMEDILEVYHLPYDPDYPVVCMDESSKQLIGEVHTPIPCKPGQPKRMDDEYVRHGVAEIFMEVEPLAGRRHVAITERRTRKDWAQQIKQMLDERYPEAIQVRLVMDNLNTHNIASLYETFEPKEARRLAERLDIHYTPKHGSWLNMAEIELSVLKGQCLNRRIAEMVTMQAEVAAWESHRNSKTKKINWQFTTADARIKLTRLYPNL